MRRRYKIAKGKEVLTETSHSEYSAPPGPFPGKLNCLAHHCKAEEDKKDDACCERGDITVRSAYPIDVGMATGLQLSPDLIRDGAVRQYVIAYVQVAVGHL